MRGRIFRLVPVIFSCLCTSCKSRSLHLTLTWGGGGLVFLTVVRGEHAPVVNHLLVLQRLLSYQRFFFLPQGVYSYLFAHQYHFNPSTVIPQHEYSTTIRLEFHTTITSSSHPLLWHSALLRLSNHE